MAVKAKKAKTTKKTKKPKTQSKGKKERTSQPKYKCEACGVIVTISQEGLGVHRLMCCGQPMKKA